MKLKLSRTHTSSNTNSNTTSHSSGEISIHLPRIHFQACIWDISDCGLVIVYVILFIWCSRLILDHRHSWRTGQANGLIWYLVCTVFLCLFRSIGFAMVPFAGRACDERYKSWQWDVDGSGDGRILFDFALIVLSSASSGLFFTSYTYFAHSLAKVLDMLTTDHASNSSHSGYRFLVVLSGLNICVWLSIFSLWTSTILEWDNAVFIDQVAQVSIAFAALTTCVMFSVHFARAYCFLRRSVLRHPQSL